MTDRTERHRVAPGDGNVGEGQEDMAKEAQP